jgi:predicted ester cyclase
MTMDHSATMQRCYDLINEGDIDGFGELLAEGFVEHEELPGLAPTKDGVIELFRAYRAAFPDLHMDAVDIIASGDKTVARATATGTQKGEFMGHASVRQVDRGAAHRHHAIRLRRLGVRALGCPRHAVDAPAARGDS